MAASILCHSGQTLRPAQQIEAGAAVQGDNLEDAGIYEQRQLHAAEQRRDPVSAPAFNRDHRTRERRRVLGDAPSAIVVKNQQSTVRLRSVGPFPRGDERSRNVSRGSQPANAGPERIECLGER